MPYPTPWVAVYVALKTFRASVNKLSWRTDRLGSGMNGAMKRTWSELEPRSIERAIDLWHELGSEEFIAQTKFRESSRYVVMDRGQRLASKPLVAMAFQLQFGCGADGPPRLSGGSQTRGILARLGYELVDIHDEDNQDVDESFQITVSSDTKFWWANQSANFDTVYEDGTLWAPLTDSLGQQVEHWRSLGNVVPGDLVIHYARPEVRGISRVVTTPQSAYPPRGYDNVDGDRTGTLVLTEPLHEIHIPRERALDLLEHGRGPVTSGGALRNGYFFSIDADRGREMLQQAGLETTSGGIGAGWKDSDPTEAYNGGATDRWAMVAVRVEQRFLRDQQLQRRGSSCSLCGRSLPKELLAAAHIKPRWACSELERMDTFNVSMLACLLGCDALFELGYVVISEEGIIELGSRDTGKIGDRLGGIVGLLCGAHSDQSKQYFAWHRQHHSAKRAHRF